jgi:uncharacterized protein YjiS (DUF1127 family)
MLSYLHAARTAVPHGWADPRATWQGLLRFAHRSWRNAVTRRELMELDDRILADIGLTRGQAVREADRFPWDARPRRERPRSGSRQSVLLRIDAMWQRHRSRRRIAQLDTALLKDIGVSFAEAEAEANKRFWQS